MRKGKSISSLALVLCAILVLSTCSLDNTPPQSNDKLFKQVEKESNWKVFRNNYTSRSLEDITTYHANGIIADNLNHVIANDSILAVGSMSSGLSYMYTDDLGSPRGKVSSYLGLGTDISVDRFGFSGFAIHPDTNKIYGWYDSEIIDVEALKPIYRDAPGFTITAYGDSLNRFVIDAQGTFWIGTNNIENDGSRIPGYDNGLYAISIEDAGVKELIIDQPIWNVFEDSNNILWVSAQDGLYKICNNKKPDKVDFIDPGYFVEQTFEYDGFLYFVIKNFFTYSPDDKEFKLYKLDSSGETISLIDSITKNDEKGYWQVRVFEFRESLYFALSGNSHLRYLNENNKIVRSDTELNDYKIGQYNQHVSGDNLYSVGNIGGISVFNGETLNILTQASTAEELISNNIFTLYIPEDQEKVYIGPYIGGGISYFLDGHFTTIGFPDESSISSMFSHKGELYVQGSGDLGILKNNSIETKTWFYTNSRRSTYDSSGYLWAYPNFGSGTNSVIAMMDLDSYEIHRKVHLNGRDYYEHNGNRSTEDNLFWTFDHEYRFNHVQSIPNSTDMMIAVSEGTGDFAISPHSLQYSHNSNTFTKIPVADSTSNGIMLMASNDSALYGVGPNQLYKFRNSEWVKLYPLKLRGDFRDMIIVDSYLIIASGWKTGSIGTGIEIVNLETGETKRYTSNDIPLPTDAVLSLAAQSRGSSSVRLWFGTNDGVAYCDVSL